MLQSVLAEAKEFLDVGNLGSLRINQRVNMSHVVLEIKIVEKLWGNNPENDNFEKVIQLSNIKLSYDLRSQGYFEGIMHFLKSYVDNNHFAALFVTEIVNNRLRLKFYKTPQWIRLPGNIHNVSFAWSPLENIKKNIPRMGESEVALEKEYFSSDREKQRQAESEKSDLQMWTRLSQLDDDDDNEYEEDPH